MRARRRRPERHATRFVLTALFSAVLLLTLLLTAFGTWSANPVATSPLAEANVLPGGQPLPQIVATVGTVQLQLPVAQTAVTAIGYHQAGDGSLALDPVGRQGNAGVFARIWHRLAGAKENRLVWYQLRGDRGPGTSALAVGAAPGTDVYAPVDGTVVGITDFVLANRTYGARIDIRPHAAPSVVVSLTHLRADPALTVGSAVTKARSKMGVVVDLTAVERQALARYTQDAGNNVSLSVRPAAVLSVRLKLLFIGDVVGCARPPGGRGAAARTAGGARRLVLRRQRREPRGRGGDHAQARGPGSGCGRGRDHTRQPHLAALRDQQLPPDVRAGDPARQLLEVRARARVDGRSRRRTAPRWP